MLVLALHLPEIFLVVCKGWEEGLLAPSHVHVGPSVYGDSRVHTCPTTLPRCPTAFISLRGPVESTRQAWDGLP